jgi:hypothetical protein
MAPTSREAAAAVSLPSELDERIAALESHQECGEDFDPASLCWLFLLGVAIPAALLLIGWRLG